MITTIDAEIYTYEGKEVWSIEKQKEFFDEHGEDSIIELVSDNGLIHMTYDSMKGLSKTKDIRIPLCADVFKMASERTSDESMWIVCDDEGNYLTVLKAVDSYYYHVYGEGEINLDFLNKYDALVFYGLNEYAVELYCKAIPYWKGHRVVLCGEWEVMGEVLPGIKNKEVMLMSDWGKNGKYGYLEGVSDNVLHIRMGLPRNENISRLTERREALIEEVMEYTFCFCNRVSFGDANPDKKYFLIDGHFHIEGIFGIQDKVFNMARFAKAKGFVPLFYIVNSGDNMYSDKIGEDIWGKFMNQPDGVELAELKDAKNIYISPNANCLNILRFMMQEDTPENVKLTWPNGLYNKNVETYIKKYSNLLKEPENTLGVLIRGTDYKKTKMPGHAIHADVPMMAEKIAEIEKNHPYKYIYLATEDAEILEEMKALYSNRLIFSNQERFTVKSGELLISLHGEKTKKEGEGFRLGAEYLNTIRLLSRCESVIASGACGGIYEAIKENGGKYRMTYIFDLGINSRK